MSHSSLTHSPQSYFLVASRSVRDAERLIQDHFCFGGGYLDMLLLHDRYTFFKTSVVQREQQAQPKPPWAYYLFRVSEPGYDSKKGLRGQLLSVQGPTCEIPTDVLITHTLIEPHVQRYFDAQKANEVQHRLSKAWEESTSTKNTSTSAGQDMCQDAVSGSNSLSITRHRF